MIQLITGMRIGKLSYGNNDLELSVERNLLNSKFD